MQLNMQMDGSINGEPEQASSSDDGQLLVALRKMMKKEIEGMVISTVQQLIKPIMKKEIELMVINTVQQVIGPTIEDLIRKVVKEEIQSAEKKLLTGGTRNYANEMTMSKERSLQLMFLGEVSDSVLTGKVINGKGGNSMRVALVDRATGQIVECGPESSAKAEILVLDASGDDNEHNVTLENFNNMIIREGDKKKPHFAKSVYVCLKEGVGILNNAKLGHDSNWMMRCKCRLGARIMENFRGIKVQEAWTESFMVLDSRSKLTDGESDWSDQVKEESDVKGRALKSANTSHVSENVYEKHHSPSLSDEVWRLKNIGRDGEPCKRLKKENISTVQDFLFLHSVDPQRLQQIVGAGAKKWKATVDHAWTCNIDDKRMSLYYPSTESKMGVIFDAVGRLKGVIQESHCVPMNNLSDDEKDCAHKLCLSAFENRKDITFFEDEASLLKQFPYRSSDINAATNSSIQHGSNGCDLSISENRNGYHPTEPEPGTSSQSISPDNLVVSENINRYHPAEPSTSSQNISPNNLTVPENINGYHPMETGTSSQSISTDNLAVSENINGYHPTEQGTSSQSIILDNLVVSESINGYHPTEPGTSSQSIIDNLAVSESINGCHPTEPGTSSQSIIDNLAVSESINGYHPTEPGTSSQSISPDIRTTDHPNNINHFGSLESTDTGQLYDANLGVLIKFPSCQFSDLENINKYVPRDPCTSSLSITSSIRTFDLPNSILHFGSFGSPTMGQLYEAHSDVQIPSSPFPDVDSILERFGEDGNFVSPLNPEINNPSQALRAESNSFLPNNIFNCNSLGSPTMGQQYEAHSGVQIPSCKFSYSDLISEPSGDNWSLKCVVNSRQSNARVYRLVGRVVNAKLWMVRAKKRVMALGGIHVHKKQRI